MNLLLTRIDEDTHKAQFVGGSFEKKRDVWFRAFMPAGRYIVAV